MLGILFNNCEDDGPGKRDWPGINTLEVTNISDKGAQLNAEIIYRGNYGVLKYGFVWSESENPSLNNADRVVLSGDLTSGKFSAEISTTLKQGKTYWVKSFVETADYTVYGEGVSFKSLGSQAPVITSFSPASGNWGDTIKISGEHFSFLSPNNVVMFGTISAQVISSTDSLIITTVPSVINSEIVPISVSIFGNKAVSGGNFSYLKPRITGISPQQGTFDDIITITGIDFSPVIEKNIVKFNDHLAQVIEASSTSLTVKVPREISHSINLVTVNVNQLLSNSDISFTILQPTISSILPNIEFIGGALLINGNNFNPLASGDSILFNGNPGVIQSATKNTIIVKVPTGIYNKRSFPIEVRVAGLNAMSLEAFTLKDTWIRKADVPHQASGRNSATAFSINGIGYVGLGYGFVGSNFWKYDPQSNEWSEIAPFPYYNRERAASFVIGNKAYVGLGRNNLHDFWCYNPVTNRWTGISEFPASNNVTVSLSLNNKGYIVTDQLTANFWEYDAVSDSWTQKKDFPRSSGMYPFYPDAGFTINDKIYIYAADGTTADNQLWEYNFSTDTWTRKSDIIDSYLDRYTTGFSVYGKGYIRGNKYLFKYDPSLNSWSALPQDKNVPGPFYYRGRSFAFLINNLVYFGTSYEEWGNGDYLYDLWEFNPNYE
jgi:hypothetical protein